MAYRIIYNVLYTFERLPSDQPRMITSLFVPLKRSGQASGAGDNGRPRPPKRRTIDLRVGDQMMCAGQWRTISAIESSANWLTDQQAASWDSDDGYIYHPTDREPEPQRFFEWDAGTLLNRHRE